MNTQTYEVSRHFTVVFNAFVFMQVFGFFAARRIDDSLNIFKGVHKSFLFLSIVVIVAAIQTLLLQFGGNPVGCSSSGLSGVKLAICIAFGFGVLIANFILKFLPDPGFRSELENKEEQENESKMSEANDQHDFSAINELSEKQPLMMREDDSPYENA